MSGAGAPIEGFDGQGVQPAIQKFLQRIIHKAVTSEPAHARKALAADAHPKMRAIAGITRTRMPGMGSTFVDHLKLERRQALDQAGVQLGCSRQECGRCAHGLPSPGGSSFCRYLFKYKAWASTKANIRPMPPKSLKLTQALVENW